MRSRVIEGGLILDAGAEEARPGSLLIEGDTMVSGNARRLPGRRATCQVTAVFRFASRFSTPW